MPTAQYPPDYGPHAILNEEEKKNRLDAMVRIWQSDTQRRIEREGYRSFIKTVGLNEYRYSVWLRFPEWERSSVVGQVITLRSDKSETAREDTSQKSPVLFSSWRREPLLKMLPDWKQHLPNETVFNIAVRITPGGLGEGS